MATSAPAAALSSRELRAWRGLLRVHAALAKSLDADLEREHGLPLSSYEVLVVLHDAEGRRMRMCDLATSVVLSRSGLTRLIDRLERDGLVVRVACPGDARGAFATLTPAGREKLLAARGTHLRGVRRLFLDLLAEDEQDLLGEVWERVLAARGGSCGC
jgi:DNA-binding MarR family transcriptional regulator